MREKDIHAGVRRGDSLRARGDGNGERYYSPGFLWQMEAKRNVLIFMPSNFAVHTALDVSPHGKHAVSTKCLTRIGELMDAYPNLDIRLLWHRAKRNLWPKSRLLWHFRLFLLVQVQKCSSQVYVEWVRNV